MSNVWGIVKGDVRRLFSNVMSVIIAVGLVVMPSIFAWYNIIACWNVFDNTGNLKVAVANADAGYQSDLVPLRVNVGEQVVSALRANDQIDWTFTTEDDAIDGARSGRYYAAVVIPESFSRDMLTFYDANAESASIVYYANEKKSAIAPKITDQGADTVSYQVNEVFAETLSEVGLSLAEALARYADQSDLGGSIADLTAHLRGLADEADRTADVLSLYASLAQSAQSLANGSVQLIDSAHQAAGDASAAAFEGVTSVSDLGSAVAASADDLSAALDASVQGLGAVEQNVDALFDASSGQMQASAGQMREQAELLESHAAVYRSLAGQLASLGGSSSGADQALEAQALRLNATADMLDDAAGHVREAAGKLEAGDANVQAQRDEVKRLASEAKATAQQLKSEFDGTVRPGLQQVAADAAAFAERLDESRGKLDAVGADLSGSMGAASEKMAVASGKIDEASQQLRDASSKLRDVAGRIDGAVASGDANALRDVLGSDTQALSRALAAPVSIDRAAVFPADSFGSAMAPLYTTLALFIGSLLILVVVKPTVSDATRATLRNPKPCEVFFGRFGVMALISLAQTTLMGLGNMLFLQVQVAHPWLFMLCFWFAGLVFTFFIYALVVSFANLGKAMAVLLLIAQVTGCGGSFPLQLLPGFIQALSPWLPATHVVNAMRAAMFGTYGNDFWVELGVLALFLIPALALGLVLRKPLARFMTWYVEQVESSKLIG